MFRRRQIPRGVALASLVAGPSACPSSPTCDPAAEPRAFSYATDVIPTRITIGATGGMAIVDTGSPMVILDQATFPGLSSACASSGCNVHSMTVGSVTPHNVMSISDELPPGDPCFPTNSVVGFSAMSAYVATFNYRDRAGPPSPPASFPVW